jgi:hypothetical protein
MAGLVWLRSEARTPDLRATQDACMLPPAKNCFAVNKKA